VGMEDRASDPAAGWLGDQSQAHTPDLAPGGPATAGEDPVTSLRGLPRSRCCWLKVSLDEGTSASGVLDTLKAIWHTQSSSVSLNLGFRELNDNELDEQPALKVSLTYEDHGPTPL
jgi:hypothetical protein